MSGGHWQYFYNRWEFEEVIDDLNKFIDNDKNPDEPYSDYDLVLEAQEAIKTIRLAQVYLKEFEWLFSGDTSEESCLRNIQHKKREIL